MQVLTSKDADPWDTYIAVLQGPASPALMAGFRPDGTCRQTGSNEWH